MGPGMGMGMQMRPEMKQQLILAPRMIQSMEILQLPIMALQERIQQELVDNPVLELQESKDDVADETLAEEGPTEFQEDRKDPNDPRTELVIDANGNGAEDFDRLEKINQDWADHFNEEHSRVSSNRIDEEGDRRHDFEQNMPSRPQSLQDFVNEQLSFIDCPAEQLRLVRFIVTHIDDRGYLATALEEIGRGFDTPVTPEQLEEALKIVQKCDPRGVGARNTSECLLLQLTAETPQREVVRVLIQNHLEDITHNRLPLIQKKTGFDLQTINEAIEVLRHLELRPAARFTADNIPYVVPDIVVERTEAGDYTVRLLDDWVPSIYISKRYIELYKDRGSDPKAREYLKRKIQAAQWLMEAIEQRRNTLEKVTRAIIQHQRKFLDQGPEHIEPLKMQQIADQVKVHVTTVSRAVDDKWVQTPRGIFPLKRFFGGGTHTASGEEVAWETIKNKLLEIIANEDKAEPLSDEDLVTKLSQAGYPVARRTVTKYRKTLKIQSSRQRKLWAK
jgi:RNA polymerase sigma-54 factor